MYLPGLARSKSLGLAGLGPFELETLMARHKDRLSNLNRLNNTWHVKFWSEKSRRWCSIIDCENTLLHDTQSLKVLKTQHIFCTWTGCFDTQAVIYIRDSVKPASSVHLCQGLGAHCGLWTVAFPLPRNHSPSRLLLHWCWTCYCWQLCSRPAAATGFHLPQHLEATRRVTWERDPGGYSCRGPLFGPLLRSHHAVHLGDCLSQVAETVIDTAQLLQLRMLRSKYLAKETLIDCRVGRRLSLFLVHRTLTAAVVAAAAVCHLPDIGRWINTARSRSAARGWSCHRHPGPRFQTLELSWGPAFKETATEQESRAAKPQV